MPENLKKRGSTVTVQTLDLCFMYLVKSLKGRLVQDFHLVVTDNQLSEVLGAGQGT
jgi:hypothetical protein